mmetsp:Transcript_11424/g.19527  ORF Transcript_11424/g.19527 Transcript_11424/m.19527 type:complete len:108 (-) Transcript_11424:217-540(-)|eukprot:CAMPEP_0198210888 /NCGR_PEP_ID=MMETSP1445-20131203/22501_1 /TAXON_ID=36898 /ORGANISM="Pyramimonas sp., Strain CCMP2087" /LENGTH=107 /DNA_ID=CAMNT_0043885051 /DNA_START=168 /DNA_END=491 /DNA_ORIENTATION=+
MASPVSVLQQVLGADTRSNPEQVATSYLSVKDAILKTKESDVVSVLEQLNPMDRDKLMKYLYMGLSTGEAKLCASCLIWHEKLTNIAGNGAIIRSLSDKSTPLIVSG